MSTESNEEIKEKILKRFGNIKWTDTYEQKNKDKRERRKRRNKESR